MAKFPVERTEDLAPSIDGSVNSTCIAGPDEGFVLAFVHNAEDGGLQFGDRSQHT